jgi:hypothetical protein
MLTPAAIRPRAFATLLKHGCRLLAVAAAMTGSAWAADNPFIGTWKLDSARSRLPDEMKIEQVGPDKYGFDFGGGVYAEVIAADGTDQPGIAGTTFSVTAVGPNHWKVVRKKDGKVLLVANWLLSRDGGTIDDDYTQMQAGGSDYHVAYVYKRAGAGSGLAGDWKSTQATVKSPYELQIQPSEGGGLAFSIPTEQTTKRLSFDGKDHTYERPDVKRPLAASMRQLDDLTVEVTDKVGDRVLDTQEFRLSPDHGTLTMTVRSPGGGEPQVLVFGRQQKTRA